MFLIGFPLLVVPVAISFTRTIATASGDGVAPPRWYEPMELPHANAE